MHTWQCEEQQRPLLRLQSCEREAEGWVVRYWETTLRGYYQTLGFYTEGDGEPSKGLSTLVA